MLEISLWNFINDPLDFSLVEKSSENLVPSSFDRQANSCFASPASLSPYVKARMSPFSLAPFLVANVWGINGVIYIESPVFISAVFLFPFSSI